MDTKDSSKPSVPANADRLGDIVGELEKPAGLLEHVQTVRHSGLLLCDFLERRFRGVGVKSLGDGYVSLTFSLTEVDRALWLANNLSLGGHFLNETAEDIRRALIEAGA